MVPHAGYIYSGAIAAQAYARILAPSTAIVLGPNHTGDGPKISVWASGAWTSPLGNIRVDETIAGRLLSALNVRADREAHRREHAIEVQVPFLQTLSTDIKIVPVVLGHLSLPECLRVGHVLSQISQAFPETLLVASTDMSHYVSAEEAKQKDSLALKCVDKLDGTALYETVRQESISMCGFIPTTSVLEAVRSMGTTWAEQVQYGNSGEHSGDFDHVVGYASTLFP